jgi:hypothetical protein
VDIQRPGGHIGAFQQNGPNAGVPSDQLQRGFDVLLAALLGIKGGTVLPQEAGKFGGMLHTHYGDRAVAGPGGRQVARGQVGAVRRKDAHPLAGRQGGSDHGQLQQRRGIDRHPHRRAELSLEQRQKAAAGGDGADPLLLQGLGRRNEGYQQALLLQGFHHIMVGGAGHHTVPYRKGKGGGIADIPRQAGEGSPVHQDADWETVLRKGWDHGLVSSV